MKSATISGYEHTSQIRTGRYCIGPVEIIGNPFYLDNLRPRNAIVNELLNRQKDIFESTGIIAKYDRDGVLIQKLKSEKSLGGKNRGSRINGSISKKELGDIVDRLAQ
ncbi:hypothetical protein HYX17_02975 [Candidatus Woesearchaeota archaeon]|nr:hypothetical protein [Candidatus Woesearchaeota archaeon]